MTGADILGRLAPWQDLAEAELVKALESRIPLVQEIGAYILASGGKRLRPILFLLACRLCGREEPSDGRYSAIFELLHCATLLHDDVIDEAQTRRGRPAAHRRYGNKAVILTGDYLMARCLALGAEMAQVKILEVLADCIARLAEGQVLEQNHQGDLKTPYPVYLEIITAKTAVLLAAATRIGAMLAEAEPAREEALGAFGLNLGVAFQIVDDYLDWAGEADVLGKPVGQDLKEGKATLPWIRALEAAPPEAAERMLALAANPDLPAQDWQWLSGQVETWGGLAAALAEAERFKDQAKKELEAFPDSDLRRLLMDLADYVCRRRR